MTPPRVSLGCGNFGGVGSSPAFFGKGNSEEEARAIMDAAWAAGIRWFDTADAYGGGSSETFIGRWRADRQPEGLIVTTKVYNPVSGDPADRGLSRDRIRRNVEGSLERLGIDRIDYYLAHDRDAETPLAETVGAFEELAAEGTIAAWGLSNHDGDAIREALGYGRPALVQNAYSLLDREDEAAVLPLCGEHGIAYVPFGPLSGGWLAGKYTRGAEFPGRLADDDAPRALRASRQRPGLRRPGAARRRGNARAASTWRRSRSPGCSRIPTSPGRSAAPPAPPISTPSSRRCSFRSRPRSETA